MSGYLFVYFTGEENDGEQIYFSLSRDGLFWKDLNNGQPVLRSTVGTRGARDPFVVRHPRTGRYYLLATDLRIAGSGDWEQAQSAGSRSLLLWQSEDLVHWSGPASRPLAVEGAGCLWAPEAIWDQEAQAFLVFWASWVQLAGEARPKQRIYGCHTRDFETFSPPFVWQERPGHIIDTTVVYADGCYYRFYKDEVTKHVCLERSASLLGEFQPVNAPTLAALPGVEGPEAYLLPDGKTWCLLADRFAAGQGYLPLLCTDLAAGEFRALGPGEYALGRTKKRHGGVLALSEEEYLRLWQAYTRDGQLLEGLYADPELVFFEGKAYLYPTTDGFPLWSGSRFSVFCAEKGQPFRQAGQVLDLAAGQVPWAVGYAWAPCVARRQGRWLFYFCGRRPQGDAAIGVAVAHSPLGPFHALEQPLLTPELVHSLGIEMDQVIDPSFYQEGDTAWLLFGNGCPAIVQLTDAGTGILPHTLRRLEGARDFREAMAVFFRQGLYHFTWCCGDTRSEDYRVCYGTSGSLFGPIRYEYPILCKNPARDILATGHHCIARLPGQDRYCIAYHRFATPLEKYPPAERGWHREVCLAPLSFTPQGKIAPVAL